jgi:hypothetical protein
MKDEETLYTVVEASKYLNKSINWLNIMRARKIGPSYIRDANRIYYRKEDLDKYAATIRVYHKCET